MSDYEVIGRYGSDYAAVRFESYSRAAEFYAKMTYKYPEYDFYLGYKIKSLRFNCWRFEEIRGRYGRDR